MTLIFLFDPPGYFGVVVAIVAIFLGHPWSFIFLSNSPNAFSVLLCMAVTLVLLYVLSYIASLKSNTPEKT